MRTSWVAMRFSWTAYIIPFLFIFSPSLLLQGDSWVVTMISVGTAIVAVWFISSGMIGYGLGRTGGWVRAASIVGGGLLLLPIEMVPWATYANLVGGGPRRDGRCRRTREPST